MPKVMCPCSYVHNLSPIPDDGYVVVRDQDFERLMDVESRGDVTTAVSLKQRVYECPQCGRLAWLGCGGSGVAFYVREATADT
jgi:hypothetical protein